MCSKNSLQVLKTIVCLFSLYKKATGAYDCLNTWLLVNDFSQLM